MRPKNLYIYSHKHDYYKYKLLKKLVRYTIPNPKKCKGDFDTENSLQNQVPSVVATATIVVDSFLEVLLVIEFNGFFSYEVVHFLKKWLVLLQGPF